MRLYFAVVAVLLTLPFLYLLVRTRRKDATLKELTELIKGVKKEARAGRAKLSWAFIYPDPSGRNAFRQVRMLPSFLVTTVLFCVLLSVILLFFIRFALVLCRLARRLATRRAPTTAELWRRSSSKRAIMSMSPFSRAKRSDAGCWSAGLAKLRFNWTSALNCEAQRCAATLRCNAVFLELPLRLAAVVAGFFACCWIPLRRACTGSHVREW